MMLGIAPSGWSFILRGLLSTESTALRLRERILQAIAAAGGVLPFARFMELALYEPGLGYYERSSRTVGRDGDFQTSVSVGPLFGELLAFRFAGWLSELVPASGDSPVHLVETGAHDGALARDILGWIRTWRPELFPRIRLWLVEPSPRRCAWQKRQLAEFAALVGWVPKLTDLEDGTGRIRGVIYSNELLDAFPVHRLAWSAGIRRWVELGVASVDGGFAWRPIPDGVVTAAQADLGRLSALPAGVLAVLPDGFVVDVCPAASEWWRTAADVLREGYLVALDYGFSDDVPLRPELPQGTLRGYRRHHGVADVLSAPGVQDLTAQVDFAAIAAAGEAAGLRTVARLPQRRWLTEVLESTLPPGAGFPDWDSARVRQFQTLTHPEHLGRRFQVLVQKAGDRPR